MSAKKVGTLYQASLLELFRVKSMNQWICHSSARLCRSSAMRRTIYLVSKRCNQGTFTRCLPSIFLEYSNRRFLLDRRHHILLVTTRGIAVSNMPMLGEMGFSSIDIGQNRYWWTVQENNTSQKLMRVLLMWRKSVKQHIAPIKWCFAALGESAKSSHSYGNAINETRFSKMGRSVTIAPN
jgi:hypothetical protein